MTYYRDLSEYEYLPRYRRGVGLKNVGWLSHDNVFETETTVPALIDRLWSLCGVSVAQTRGIHQCDFCDSEFFVKGGPNGLLLGAAEIRVFEPDGLTVYSAPNLIYHYVEGHRYKPPAEFVQAVLRGPIPPESVYFDRLSEFGFEWQNTSDEKPEWFTLT